MNTAHLFWFWGSAFLLGVIIGTAIPTSVPQALFFLALASVLATLQIFGLRASVLVGIAGIFLLGGYWHGHQVLEQYRVLPETQKVEGIFRVVEVTEEASFYNKVILEGEQSLGGKILWQAPLYQQPLPGELYTLSCELTRPENFTPDFDYRRYLEKEQITYVCKKAAVSTKEHSDTKSKMYRALYTPRFWLEGMLQKLYPAPESSLAEGLLLGGSNRLSDDLEDQFRRLGLTHIVAVSGYNIVIIINVFLLVGIWCGLYRKKAIAVALVGIALFIVMIGAPASAVRAGLMTGAALGSFFIGRPSYSFRALFLAVLVMTLWNPFILLFDAGFQLSFLATVAVLFSLSLGQNIFSERPLLRFLEETIWLSFFVYLFLLPILLYHFGQFTPLSVLANSIFLPLVPVAMLLSFTGAIILSFLPPLGLVAGWLGYIPLTFVIRGTEFLSHVSFASIPLQLSLPLVLLWYIGVCFFLFRYEHRKNKRQYEKNFTCPHIH